MSLVYYHVSQQCASHVTYMKELGVWEQCEYPRFSNDPMAGFRNLAHDLSLAGDFLEGSSFVLRSAAARDSASWAKRRADLEAGYVGDTPALEKMRNRFREGRYREVLALARKLRYPERMSETQHKMVAIARMRA